MLNLETENTILFHLLELFRCFLLLLPCAFPAGQGEKSVVWLSERWHLLSILPAHIWDSSLCQDSPLFLSSITREAGNQLLSLFAYFLCYLAQTTYGSVEHLDLFLFPQIKFLKNWKTLAFVLCYRNSQFLFWQANATKFGIKVPGVVI